MTTLLVAKQYVKNFISKYEVYLKPLMKLVLALAALMMINAKKEIVAAITDFKT